MLRIAVQSKGRLYDETMDLLSEAGIKLTAVKRSLLVPSRNFPVELLFLRETTFQTLWLPELPTSALWATMRCSRNNAT